MFSQLGPLEIGLIMMFAVLMFGKRLPEVGRSLGKGIIEFKKGLRGMEEEFTDSASSFATPSPRTEPESRPYETPELSVPKFEPPTSAPVAHPELQPQPHRE